MIHGDLRALDLPLVGFGADAEHGRFAALGRRVQQVGDEAVWLHGVVVHKFCQRVELVVRGDVDLQRKNRVAVTPGPHRVRQRMRKPRSQYTTLGTGTWGGAMRCGRCVHTDILPFLQYTILITDGFKPQMCKM